MAVYLDSAVEAIIMLQRMTKYLEAKGEKKTFLLQMEIGWSENNMGRKTSRGRGFTSPLHFVLSRSICIISKEVIAKGAGP